MPTRLLLSSSSQSSDTTTSVPPLRATGVGKGVLGLAVKPIVGVGDAVVSVIQGASQSAQARDDTPLSSLSRPVIPPFIRPWSGRFDRQVAERYAASSPSHSLTLLSLTPDCQQDLEQHSACRPRRARPRLAANGKPVLTDYSIAVR